jgi:hypothetical protein
MSCRYQVRVFESVEKDGAPSAGTTVAPSVQTVSIYAYSAEEAESAICKGVGTGKFGRGRVYQIWPCLGNGEFTRSIAIAGDGSSQRVLLDPAAGPFSAQRRIRFVQATALEAAWVESGPATA